jgi:hypothetical protein
MDTKRRWPPAAQPTEKPKETVMSKMFAPPTPAPPTLAKKTRAAHASTTRVQIVMDHTGDARYEFDAADQDAVALAEERFRALTGSGFRAAALAEDGGPGRLIGKFDAEVERTLFIPRLQGG